MKCLFAALLLLIVAGPVLAEDQGFPKAGSCDGKDTFGRVRFEWQGDTAKITNSKEVIAGQVVGQRKHGEGFRLSIRYEDPIFGPTEAAIFETPGVTPPEYRLAIVTFVDSGTGDRFVQSVSGYDTVPCALIW